MTKYCKLAAIAVVLASLLSGCATTQPMGASDKIYGYSLIEVDVTVNEDAYTGIFERMDDIDEVEFAAEVETKLETALTEALGSSFSGAMLARLLVHVDEMVIASGVGRALLGSESYIGAQVSIVDVDTNVTIAERHFREREKDVSFGGNLGALIEVTKNLADAALNDRVDAAARELAQAVKGWVES